MHSQSGRRLKEHGQIMKVEVEIIGFELQKKLTQLGLGISLLPRNFAQKEIQQGNLQTLNVKGRRLQGYSCLVFRKDKYIHGAMKGFFRLLQETYNPPKNGLGKYL